MKQDSVAVHKFMARVRKSRGCWIWQGYRNRDGYGVLEVAKKMWLAHRYAYELFVGPIPEGLCVLHHCDTPPCMNPEHLYAGTDADNTADKVRRNRQARAEGHGAAKLDIQGVRDIILRCYEGVGLVEISRRAGIDIRAVCNILNGSAWTETSRPLLAKLSMSAPR